MSLVRAPVQRRPAVRVPRVEVGERRGGGGRTPPLAGCGGGGFGVGGRRSARRPCQLSFFFSFSSSSFSVAIVSPPAADAQHQPRQQPMLPVLCSYVHGPVPSLVGGLDARAGAQQLLHGRAAAAHCRLVQRRLARRVAGVDLGSRG